MPIELLPLLKADFRLLLPTTRARRVQAAIAAIASRMATDHMDARQLAALDAEVVTIYQPFGLYPWWNLKRGQASPDARACEYAIAMWRLSMATGVSGKSWTDLLHPWHRRSPPQLIQDFQPFHRHTDDALDWLSAAGTPVPENLHYGYRWLARARAASAANEA